MKEFAKKNLVYIIFGISFVLCLLRAFKGFCWTDESFYLSTADRFYKGDALLVTEWYRTQLSSVICLPFYAIYMAVVGSNVGVILYFRVLYLILSFVTAFICYRVIRKDYNDAVAMIMSVLIMFYAHLNVTALSYYMMSIDFLLISLFLIYDFAKSNSKIQLIIAGVAFALSVLSLPSFAVTYIGIIICLCVILVARKFAKLPDKWNSIIDSLQLPTIIIFTMIGIAIPAVIFVIYLFCNVTIADIITAVPNILVDKEHDFTFGFCVRRFFFSISDVYGKWTYVGYVLIIGSFVLQKFIAKKIISNIIVIADALLFAIYAYYSYGHTGYIQTAVMLCGLTVYFLAIRKNHRLFWLFVPTGLCLAMTYSFSSSDFLYVLAIGHFAAALACIAFMYDYIKGNVIDNSSLELASNKWANKIAKLSAVMLIMVAVYASCTTIGLRLSNVYRDAPIFAMNVKITNGVAKGLYTTQEHLDYYEDVESVLNEFCQAESSGNDSDDTIMFSKILPWGYMSTDLKCAYPTTWRATAYNAEQLNEYYKANPTKYPDIILVLDEQYGSYDACGDVEDDHNPNLDEMNDYWKDYIKDNNMIKTSVKCGTLYKMP